MHVPPFLSRFHPRKAHRAAGTSGPLSVEGALLLAATATALLHSFLSTGTSTAAGDVEDDDDRDGHRHHTPTRLSYETLQLSNGHRFFGSHQFLIPAQAERAAASKRVLVHTLGEPAEDISRDRARIGDVLGGPRIEPGLETTTATLNRTTAESALVLRHYT